MNARLLVHIAIKPVRERSPWEGKLYTQNSGLSGRSFQIIPIVEILGDRLGWAKCGCFDGTKFTHGNIPGKPKSVQLETRLSTIMEYAYRLQPFFSCFWS